MSANLSSSNISETTGEGTPGDELHKIPGEKETLLGSDSALEQSMAGLSESNAALAEMVAGLRQDIDAMSASLQSRKSELARKEGEIRELERRLNDAVRAMRNGEEHSRQVMLELLRVRDQQEATQKFADATAVQAALAD